MNVTQRFTLMVKSQLTAVLDAFEDPERCLYQLVLDMGEEHEAAKRAAARAMANEQRLGARVERHASEAAEWQAAAEQALAKGRDDDAREALRRAELAERQHAKLADELERQAIETTEVREGVARMERRLDDARRRLELIQAQLRQAEARRAMGRVMRRAEATSLHGEFERLSERAAETAAVERAYSQLDDELSGANVRRRFEDLAIDDAVEERLARLKGDGGEAP
jgi:phage shock protein A